MRREKTRTEQRKPRCPTIQTGSRFYNSICSNSLHTQNLIYTWHTWQAAVYLEFFFDGSPDEIRDQEEALATQLASRWHGQEHFVDLCAKLIKIVQHVYTVFIKTSGRQSAHRSLLPKVILNLCGLLQLIAACVSKFLWMNGRQ